MADGFEEALARLEAERAAEALIRAAQEAERAASQDPE